jgi:hypothetical protein
LFFFFTFFIILFHIPAAAALDCLGGERFRKIHAVHVANRAMTIPRVEQTKEKNEKTQNRKE